MLEKENRLAGAKEVAKYKVEKYKRQRKILDIRKSNSPVIDGFFSEDFHMRTSCC
jgi:hypothetical protein